MQIKYFTKDRKNIFYKMLSNNNFGDAIKNSIVAMNMADKEQWAKNRIYQYFKPRNPSMTKEKENR